MKETTPSPRLAYTVAEAAKLLSLSRAQIYRLMNQGDIKFVKIGRSRRITTEQLNSFVMLATSHGQLEVIA
ncbi:MAG: helix-turn-helix domain-containing protein [Armatimonadota bacterium]